ncbi:MAG: hypothetical protein JNK81_14935 [Anaerolineales bacterium]|nr:hypothetical protein [Anaerolineales bacterium]
MFEIIKTLYELKDTPVPTLLVIGGLVFLFLAFVNQVSTNIQPDPKLKKWSVIVGVVLIVSGIGMYLIPAPQSSPTSSQSNTESNQQAQNNCASITSSEVEQLKTASSVELAIQQAENFAEYRQNDFAEGAQIPSNVVIAMNLQGEPSQFPVVSIKSEGGWGVFLTTDTFSAPYRGTYWCIQP